MASPTQRTIIESRTSAPASTAAPAPMKFTTGWPVGDTLLKSLELVVRTNMSAAGALVTAGRLAFLQNIYFATDKHGIIIGGSTDGWMLDAICKMLNPYGDHGAYVTSTQDGVSSFRIPLERWGGIRPLDTALDLLLAKPTLELTYRAGSAIETGAGQVDNLDVDLACKLDPGPVSPEDFPAVMPHIETLSFSGLSAGRQTFELPYGDRTYLGIVMRQCVAATGVPVNDTVVGTAATQTLSVKRDGFPFIDRLPFRTLKDMNRVDYNAYQTLYGALGITFIDFQQFMAPGRMLTEGIVANSAAQGRMTFEVDTAAFGANALQLGLVSVKPVPVAARRAAPAPAK